MSNEDGSGPAFPDIVTDFDYDRDAGKYFANTYSHGGLSQRAYAAIHLRVPDSGLSWLDAMIERARRESPLPRLPYIATDFAAGTVGGNAEEVSVVLAQGRKG